jgi:2-polyprenyl-6-methoxyphenol hydroxylase-like FAD-dependent oxidoreductase
MANVVEEYEVIVVGAGPVGLTLAIDLGRRGVRCLLIERNSTTALWPRMVRFNSRTMEFYRRIGIADRVRALGCPPSVPMDVFVVTRLCDPPLAILPYPSVSHARGQIAACLDGSLPLEPCQFVSQNDLEPLLKEVAESMPTVTVRYSCELVDTCQNGTAVDAWVRPKGDSERLLRGDYLVSCDGGQSIVRKRLRVKLQGQGRIRRACQVIFKSDDLFEKISIGKVRQYNFSHPDVETLVVQGSLTEFNLLTSLPPESDFEAVIREVVGFSCQIDIRHVESSHYNFLVADCYRDRRIVLAGDAAHVIPAGGLGMNTGVGDAVDLSWKLAGTIKGWGGPGLLDSYERERRPVGLRNRDASEWALASAPVWRKLITPSVRDDTPEGAAVRAAIASSATVNHCRMHDMPGVEYGYSYAGSPLIADEAGNVAEWDTIIYTPDTRPGVRIPHMWLKDGRALHDMLGDGFALLDLVGDAQTGPLEKAFRKLGAPLRIVRLDEPELRTVYGFKIFLLRPDLHIAWRGDTSPPDPIGLALRATGGQDLTSTAVYSSYHSFSRMENDQSYAVALYELGRAYEFGRRGVARNKAKAIYWYQEAAKRGNSEAQYWLGRKYEQGQDLPKNIDRALFWLRRAAGHDQSDLVQNSAERELVRLKRQVLQ